MVGAARARTRLAWLARNNAKADDRFVPGRAYGPTRAQARRVADAINLWTTTYETVGVKAEEKSKGGYRPIYIFGLEHRARQEMLRLVLANRANIDPRQYALQRGLRAAQRAILAALATGRYHYVVTADISAFFPSIDVTALPQLLGLPPAIVDSNVTIENFNVDRRQMAAVTEEITNYERLNPQQHYARDYSPYDGGVRTYGIHSRHSLIGYMLGGQTTPGIAQGPSCSPVIAEYVAADLVRRMMEISFMILWVDDFIILAETQEEAERAVKTFRAALAAARGGPFDATAKIAPVAPGFKYLGSDFGYRDGIATVAPTRDKRRDFHHNMRKHLHRISHAGTDPTEARQYLSGWLEANSLWSQAVLIRQDYQRKLAKAQQQFALYYQGQTTARKREIDSHLRATGDVFVNPRRRRSRAATGSGYFRR